MRLGAHFIRSMFHLKFGISFVGLRFYRNVMHPIDALAKTTPLDPAEEAVLVGRARAGSAEAKETLVEHYILYALKIARRRFASNRQVRLEEDSAKSNCNVLGEHEIYEIASDGLLEAVEKFDPARGKQLATLVAYYVGFRGLNLLRALRINKEDATNLDDFDLPDVTIPETLPEDDLWEIRMTELETALVKESVLVQNIVRRHLDGEKFEAIASKLGYKSTTSVQKRFNDFVSKFQVDFQKRYPEYYGANQ